MAQPRIGQKVVVDVPATTANLGPGFDCLGAALDLNNRFAMQRIEGSGERFELIIEGSEGTHLRGGPDNLVYRAAQRVWKAAGIEPGPWKQGFDWPFHRRVVWAAVPRQSWLV